jgi:hypothetical protein
MINLFKVNLTALLIQDLNEIKWTEAEKLNMAQQNWYCGKWIFFTTVVVDTNPQFGVQWPTERSNLRLDMKQRELI